MFERLTPIGAEVLAETMRLVEAGTAPRAPQDQSGVTLAPTFAKADARIDWSRPVVELHNKIRAFVPWPVATCSFRGEPLKLWRSALGELCADNAGCIEVGQIVEVRRDRIVVAACGGILEILEVQAAGRPRMNAGDWARGTRVLDREQLNS